MQPVGLDDTPRGTALLAVDSVGAGVHEKVLMVIEGRAAGEALGRKGAPVDAAIIGIVDSRGHAGMTEPELAALVRDVIARHRRDRTHPQATSADSTSLDCSLTPATGCSCCQSERQRRPLPDRARGDLQSLRLL